MHPVIAAWHDWILELVDAEPPEVPSRFSDFSAELQALAAAGEIGKRQSYRGALIIENPNFAFLDALLRDGKVTVASEEIPAEYEEYGDDDYGDDPDWDEEYGYEENMTLFEHQAKLADGQVTVYDKRYADYMVAVFSQPGGPPPVRAAAVRYATSRKYHAQDYVPPTEGVRLALSNDVADSEAPLDEVSHTPYAVRLHPTDGESRVVLRGWVFVGAMAVAHDRVAALVAERPRANLDASHPDFALTSAASATSSQRPVADSFGAVHIVSHRSATIARVKLVADRISVAMQGRLLAAHRDVHEPNEWGTALFAVTADALTPIALLDTDIGELRAGSDRRLWGAYGFEVLGAGAALEAVEALERPWTPKSLGRGLALPEPPPPPPETIAVVDGALTTRYTPSEYPYGDAPDFDADWVSAPGPSGDFLWANQTDDGWELGLGLANRESVSLAIPPAKLFSITLTKTHAFIGADKAVWSVDFSARRATLALESELSVSDVTASGDILYVLFNIHEAAGELCRYSQRDGEWHLDGGFPVTGFTGVDTGRGGDVVALTIRDAPSEIAFTMVFVWTDGEFRMVGRLAKWLSGMWDHDGETVARFEREASYILDVPETSAADAFVAQVFDVREGGWGKRAFFVRKTHDFAYFDLETRELVTPFSFTTALSFDHNCGRVRVPGGRMWALVSRDGDLVMRPRHAWIGPCEDGARRYALGAVEILDRAPKVARWGLVTKSGEPLFPATFDNILAPGADQHVASARLSSSEFGLVDLRDGTIVARGYDQFARTCDGVVPMRRDGTWGLARLDGTWLIPNTYLHSSEVTAGRVFLKNDEGWACFDVTTGDVITPERYDSFSNFFEGASCVSRDGLAGFLDLDGRLIGETLRFSRTFRFYDGFAPVIFEDNTRGFYARVDDRSMGDGQGWQATYTPSERRGGFRAADGTFGQIDLASGTVLIEGLEAMHSYRDGVLCAKRDGAWGLVAADGSWLLEPSYQTLAPAGHGQIRAQFESGLWGTIGLGGDTVVEPRFAKMEDVVDGVMVVRRS